MNKPIYINEHNLTDIMLKHDVPPAASIQHLVLHLLEEADEKSLQRLQIQISLKLLPKSYRTVPAMFARALFSRQSFASLNSRRDGEYLRVEAATSKVPTTFKARARNTLRELGYFSCLKTRVPNSYRERPEIFASIMTRDMGVPVRWDRQRLPSYPYLDWKVLQ